MDKRITEINKLKKEKKAIILAHYYAPSEVQEIADYVGDSYYLAKIGKTTECDMIVFCGVNFMGESVKILNPTKKVLMPDLSADCPMAHMAQISKIKELRQRYEDLAVVCYINSTAELKCESDVCVTSSNAVKIVKALPNKNIFFIPDQNLGAYVKKQVPEKNIILNDGYCPIHKSLTKKELLLCKGEHKGVSVLSHPECCEEILAESDYIGSTKDIIDYVKKSEAKEFIIATEEGVSYQLIKDNPDKKFYFAKKNFTCQDMKLNTLDSVLTVLMDESNEVLVSDEKRERALKPLDRMLALAK